MLVKYKNLKLLAHAGVDIQPLIQHLSEIEALALEVENFYINLMHSSRDDAYAIKDKAQALISKIGYEIIGVPFTTHDAELYALDKKLDYDVLELHGNTGKANAAKEETKDSHVHMRVTREQKAIWVKQAQAKKMKLAEWITKKLNNEI